MEKSRIIKGSAEAYVDILKTSGLPYKLTISNYTVKIESDLFNYHFLKNQQSNKCFAAYSKLKKDLKNFALPDVTRADTFYFTHDFKKDHYIKEAVSIDLKSAYATTLMLRDLLSADTYNYISTLNKQDRLASVGMLASRKEVFTFNSKNKIINYETITNPFEPFFYQCVRDTFEIIRYARFLAEASYLFSWVDCIYVRPDTTRINDILSFLDSNGINYTVKPLREFKVKQTKKGSNVSFWEVKDDVCEKKFFNLPTNRFSLAKEMTALLINKDLLNDNYSKIRLTTR